jgi:hypothetical protein
MEFDNSDIIQKKNALLKPSKKLSLYKAIKIGYLRDKKKQSKILKKYGYVLDPTLSDDRQYITAYNPFSNKLLRISNGTDFSNAKDVRTDVALAVGKLKNTERFKEERNSLLKAKKKYNEKETVFAAHSLGGNITNALASAKDQVYNYNPAYTIGQKARPNVMNIRTQGDIFSTFSPTGNTTVLPSILNTMQILEKPKESIEDIHSYENIKRLPVFL